MSETLKLLSVFLKSGGWVLALLLVLGVWLWTILALRTVALVRGYQGAAEQIWVRPPSATGVLSRAYLAAIDAGSTVEVRAGIGRVRGSLRRFRRTIRTINATAPMLGLLGTVMGMIKTFDALDAQVSTSIAEGIAQALITTEVGLAMAIPGLMIGIWLERKEHHLHEDLDILERTAPPTGR